MNQKILDSLAVAAALIAMVATAFLFPYGAPIIRVAVGLVPSAGLLVTYFLFLRKSDDVIALEESLGRTARIATQIKRIAESQRSPKLKDALQAIAVHIARMAAKLVTRDLTGIGTHVRRLEKLSDSFLTVLGVLTGEVTLSRSQMAALMTELETQHIPETETALEALEVGIDEGRARKLLAAESELNLLRQLATTTSKAGRAAELLRSIIEDSERSKP